MQHVAEFVRHHAFDFVIVHHLQDAGGEGHRSVRRIAAGGEGVGRILGNDRTAWAWAAPCAGKDSRTMGATRR